MAQAVTPCSSIAHSCLLSVNFPYAPSLGIVLPLGTDPLGTERFLHIITQGCFRGGSRITGHWDVGVGPEIVNTFLLVIHLCIGKGVSA